MNCPKCTDKKGRKYGSFYRTSDSRRIQRFKCPQCLATFSHALKDPAYNHNKRRVNHLILKLLASSVSMRRAAVLAHVTRTTVSRKVVYLGRLCKAEHAEFLAQNPPIEAIQLDELHTIEHTKLKPLAVAIAVTKTTRKILGVAVSSMPATGYLADLSRKKYGPRPDHRRQGLHEVFKSVAPYLAPKVQVSSDEHPYYARIIRKHLPEAKIHQFKGEKSAITGQGELKRKAKDPLFSINHTLAMCRANINRLVRKTWCTTKKPGRLLDHLYIYMWMHNRVLTPT